MKTHRRYLCVALLAGLLVCAAGAARAGDNGVGLTVPNAAISTISDPNEALRYARGRIDAHDLPGAVLALRNYVTNHPEEGAVERFLGDLYLSSGDLSDANAIYRSLLQAFPFDRELHYQLGVLDTIENRLDDAMAQFRASLPDVQSIYFLVLLHQRKGDLAAFREQMQQAAAAHPEDAQAQIEAAQVFGALYRPRDAAVEFAQALAVSPNSLDALEGLALAQTQEKANAAAAQTLARCLSLDPSSYGCLVALGELDVQVRKYDEAQAALEHAYHLAPEEPEALLGLGRLADARGDWQKGVAFYEQALYVWRYSPDPYVQIAFDYEEHALRDKAQGILLEGLAIAPDDARLHYILGYLYRESGERALALVQFVAAEQSLDPEVVRFAKESADALRSAPL
ncbi:MAG TPA: tetratricopeptide repeat protein [Candidatus Tyrphobacter sp.]